MIRSWKSTDAPIFKKLVPHEVFWPFFDDPHFIKFTAIVDGAVSGLIAISLKLETANIEFI